MSEKPKSVQVQIQVQTQNRLVLLIDLLSFLQKMEQVVVTKDI